ncbi:hypothetical protein OY671_012184, partial [Metschnikowia pulcherrima]
PQAAGDLVSDHGLQPAHARGVGQQHGLQHPPADGQDLDAGQQPVLADRAALGSWHGARSRHVLAPAAGRPGGDQSQAPRPRRGHSATAGRHHPREGRRARGAAEPHAERRQDQRLSGDGQQQHAGGRQPDERGAAGLPQSGQLHRRVRRLPDR